MNYESARKSERPKISTKETNIEFIANVARIWNIFKERHNSIEEAPLGTQESESPIA